MEIAIPSLTPALLQDVFLLKRERAVSKVNSVFDGEIKELCLQTRHPRQLAGFVSACLAHRGELDRGVGTRCLFVKDRPTWESICSELDPHQILVAEPELDIDAHRSELLPLARARDNRVIYSLANPRPDCAETIALGEPTEFDVQELLKKHAIPPSQAHRLAKRSNGNVYLLTRLLTGTSDRPTWANDRNGYFLRCLALIGSWSDASDHDRNAISELVGEPYNVWIERIYPLTKQEEPPVILDGSSFRPISRYDLWQQLGRFLTDSDLTRFQRLAEKVLSENSSSLDTPSDEPYFGAFTTKHETYSAGFRHGLAESLALMGAQGRSLPCSPNLSYSVAFSVVSSLLAGADWKRWASLNSALTQLAEAAPSAFLHSVEQALVNDTTDPMNGIFSVSGKFPFVRSYYHGLLRALQVLAWNSDYLSRVSLILARLTRYELPQNSGNNPLSTLRSIFLSWYPQTLAGIDARRAAVECVIEENPQVGWSLLLSILPESHQIAMPNQKPAWRDWFPDDWSESVTRSELYRQVENYSELAVGLAMTDISKLTEIIARWDHLPREVFQRVLNTMASPKTLEKNPQERFLLWQKLTDEIERHRKYARSDWAMPEAEVQRLERAAKAIEPVDPAILHQRLFNAYEHELYIGDNYDEERNRVAKVREEAALEVLRIHGPQQILQMAAQVKFPSELGCALGRRGTEEIDLFLLPEYLGAEGNGLPELVAGYILSRFLAASIEWVRELDLQAWTSSQLGIFFASLPFMAEVWDLAEAALGTDLQQYWKRIRPNPYQAQGHILVAAYKALENHRPEIALDCLSALSNNKAEFPSELAVRVVTAVSSDESAAKSVDPHHLLEVIKHLQSASDAIPSDVASIEFQCLHLLDRFSGGRPIFLERRLSSEPIFFHEAVVTCFRSEHVSGKTEEPDEQRKTLAAHVYRLLHNWQTPPGTTTDGKINELALSSWIADVQKLCEESGHWIIAQQIIGRSLMYAPAGLEGMLQLPVVAKCLDSQAYENMRRGFTLEIFNSRGVHGFTAGKDELELARKYRRYADKYDLYRCARIATALRGLAESYERDAERESKRFPYASD